MVSLIQLLLDFGQLAGRLAFALLAVTLIRRTTLLRGSQWLALVAYPLVLLVPGTSSFEGLMLGAFVLSALVSAQLSFWGNYLPRAYPTHLRGTGESFAANVGGRILGTSAALATTQLANAMPGATPTLKLAAAAALVTGAVCASGLVASRDLPEPEREGLDE